MSSPAAPTTAGIFTKLETFFEAAWAEVKTDAVELFDETASTVESDLEALWSFAAPLAINAVLAEAPKVISGTEKFGNAVTSVFQSVEAAAKPVAIADVQAITQNAYNYIQSKLPTAS